MYYTTSGAFLISTTNQIYSLISDNKFDKILELPGQVNTFFSDDGGISINDKNIFLIPLSNGRLLTLYGNISPKSAVMIAKTIK